MALYTEVEFPLTVNLPPKVLHKGIYEEIETAVKHRLEGKCKPGIGYIKKGTVQILKKQLGKSDGSHLTGNITFNLQVHCSAAMPVVGQRLSCMVVTKNEFGLLATNYQLPAYTMLIMKMPDDTSDTLDRIQRGSYIEVEVLAYQLKADNPSERTRAEYWLVCSLANSKLEEARYQILPPVTSRPVFIANNQAYDLSIINTKRRELTGGIYADLEDTKTSIQKIRDDYINMLRESETNMHNDIMLSSMLGKTPKHFILGILEDIKPDGKMALHRVKVMWSTVTTLRGGSTYEIEVPVNPESLNISAVILYQNFDARDGTASNYNNLDFWGRHVKYIINETEMVFPNGQYLGQLTKIIMSKSKSESGAESIKSTRVGNRKIFTEDQKPIATLLYRDQHVINRAYYKMREFIKYFGDELFPKTSMKIACIAESPGGFIQALLDNRVYSPASEVKVETGIKDDITAISIGINSVPPWGQLTKSVLKPYSYVNVCIDGATEPCPRDPDRTNLLLIGGTDVDEKTGNILDPERRERFYLEFSDVNGGKADLITGDGGIERDKTETTEEMDTHRLLLAEIIMTLHCQKQGGSFILKIYDMATEFTMNMMQVLCYCYEEVGLFKPSTSRAASSEKYVVCKRFQVSEQDRLDLIKHLEAIHSLKPTNDDDYAYLGNMVAMEDPKLKQAIVAYNGFFMKKQISFIESGRTYAAMYNNTIRSGNVEKMTFDILAKIGSQVSTAEEFLSTI